MKKKLLLIPLALTGTMLTACEQTEVAPVYINEWLECYKTPMEDPNAPRFTVSELGTNYDFDFVVRNLLRNVVVGVDAVKGKPENIEGEIGLSYTIRESHNRLTGCNISVYTSGEIVTGASGNGWGAPKSQTFTYEVDPTQAAYVINKAAERYNKIRNTQNEEKINYRNASQVGNFLAALDNSAQTTVKYKDIRSDGDLRCEFSFEDTDRSILNDLKEITFEEIDNYQIMDDPSITYYVSEDWYLDIFNEHDQISYSHACVRYRYESVYKHYHGRYTNGHIFYSLDSEKGVALANKIKAMMPQN